MGVAALDTGAGEWGECLVPAVPVDPALGAQVRRRVGASPDWLRRIGPLPWLVDALCAIIGKPVAYAPPDLCNLIGLVVSQDNSCRYCYGVQRTIMRILGYSDERLDRMLRDLHLADLSPAEHTALDFARRVSRANPLPGRAECEAVAQAGFAPLAVAEIAAMAASAGFSNRVATLLALPPESLEAEAGKPLFRLLRPLMAWQMRPRAHRPEPPPAPNDGPCARLIAALGTSPMAHALRSIVDAAWASPVLPRRTKTLVLAVVARAMGCSYVETEARRLLADEGLGAADVDDILATLSSPRLDARESRLVPFARETVRYQPATIQQRMRAVANGFSSEETLEVVGITSLANTVCRLSVVIEAC
jgi:alkylhydroperoxidase family enzyme